MNRNNSTILHAALACLVCFTWGCSQDQRDSTAAPNAPVTVDLFNGKDFTGWRFETEQGDTPIDPTWKVQDGVIHCSGEPVGALLTTRPYENYRLTLDWRWKPGGPTGNAGALVHATTPKALGPWPRSLEVQLQHNSAGDFWVIGMNIEVDDPARRHDRRFIKLADNLEKPVGEWNHLRVDCQDDTITVYVNGQLANHAIHASQRRGAVGLQSEGVPVQYRAIRITPLTDGN